MKISTVCLLPAILLLTSCAHLGGKYYDRHDGEQENGTPGDDKPVDYGPPTKYEEFKVEERELTDEIKSALGTDNLAVVFAYDFLGNVFAFDNSDEYSTEDVIYPRKTSQLAKPFSVMFIPYEGSHCVDVISLGGYAERICLPAH